MGSLNIQRMRSEYPGKTDAEAGKAFAQKYGYIAIVRYKNSSSASDFTNIGTCRWEDEIRGYLNSPYCHDTEILYDGRFTALRITEDLILRGHCELCGKRATQESLQLMAGNDFYICPKCGLMFCDGCYVRLPLTSSPGYGTCSKCRVKVQRAIPGFYGEQAGASWTRKGKAFEERDAEYVAMVEYAAMLGRNATFTRVLNWADFIKHNERSTFTVCVFEGKAHLIAKIAISNDDVRILGDSIKSGRIILRTSFYPYPTYPVIYFRLFIALADGPQPGSFKGILVERAIDFTDANFQQWAVTLRGTRRLYIHAYSEKGKELASSEAEIEPEDTDIVIQAVDQANEYLKSIPEGQQDFEEAAQAFFRDHPEPFLFAVEEYKDSNR